MEGLYYALATVAVIAIVATVAIVAIVFGKKFISKIKNDEVSFYIAGSSNDEK